MEKRKKWRLAIIFFIILVLAAAIYFTFFFYYSCDQGDLACYREHQRQCAKTKFVNEIDEGLLAYKIEGKADGKCEVEVKLLAVKEGTPDKVQLEGKTMNCFLPLGSIAYPEEDLSKCHGLLREEVQEIMIRNAHSYIISNLGQIGEELEKVI